MFHNILKNLAHVAAIAATATAAQAAQTGPLTSGNVLIPAATAAGFAVIGAVIKDLLPKPPQGQ